MKVFAPLLLGGLSLGLASPAAAETVRFAVVVGNDVGNEARAPLHFAEEDAAKLARVMTELGGVAPDDMYLLQGRSRDVLAETFERVTERIATVHRLPGQRAMLLFYFSGHSDGEGIELGSSKLSFSDLRHRLTATGAEVRVAIVDACRSGALLAAKGGRLREGFEIRLADDPMARGTVLLTSSSADEDALESRELRGSYFTHHLVSGLRGAADVSGDGRITLAEAYRYAYEHTLAATAGTLPGAQHPAYDIQLSGMGELVLTELVRPSGALLLPAGFDRAFISEPSRDAVLAEVPAGAPRVVAVPPGDYLVRLWRGATVYEGRVAVGRGVRQSVVWSNLVAVRGISAVAAKGGPIDLSAADLAEAMALYRNDLDAQHAALALRRLLEREPPNAIAASAHLYLGLIALDALLPDEAQTEFQKALRLNPTLETPAAASPKARVAFGIARQRLEGETDGRMVLAAPTLAAAAASSPPAPGEAVELSTPVAPREAAHHSHLLGIGLAALGVGAATVAAYGGLQVLAYQNDIGQMQRTGGSVSYARVESDLSGAQTWRVAWLVLAGVAAAAGVASGLTW